MVVLVDRGYSGQPCIVCVKAAVQCCYYTDTVCINSKWKVSTTRSFRKTWRDKGSMSADYAGTTPRSMSKHTFYCTFSSYKSSRDWKEAKRERGGYLLIVLSYHSSDLIYCKPYTRTSKQAAPNHEYNIHSLDYHHLSKRRLASRCIPRGSGHG